MLLRTKQDYFAKQAEETDACDCNGDQSSLRGRNSSFVCVIQINFILQVAVFASIKSNHQLKEKLQGRR
jgi:hypothetical protein